MHMWSSWLNHMGFFRGVLNMLTGRQTDRPHKNKEIPTNFIREAVIKGLTA